MYKIHTYKELKWYDFKKPTRENFEEISKKLSIDSYIVEKFLKKKTSDKAIHIGNSMFISLSFPDYDSENNQYFPTPIKFIIGHNFIISAIYSKNEGLEKYTKIFETHPIKGDYSNNTCTASTFTYAFEEIYKNLIFELHYIRKELDSIEEQIFSDNEKKMVKKISITNRKIIDFKKIMKDHRKVWEIFSSLSKIFFKKRSSWEKIESLSISETRIEAEMLELRETLHELRSTNNSLLNAKQNDTMKVFTLIAFLTLPMTLFLSIISLPTKQRFIIGKENDLHIIMWILLGIFITTLLYSIWKKWWE